MMTPDKTTELNQETITIILLKGGLSLEETLKVINSISFKESTWDGKKII